MTCTVSTLSCVPRPANKIEKNKKIRIVGKWQSERMETEWHPRSFTRCSWIVARRKQSSHFKKQQIGFVPFFSCSVCFRFCVHINTFSAGVRIVCSLSITATKYVCINTRDAELIHFDGVFVCATWYTLPASAVHSSSGARSILDIRRTRFTTVISCASMTYLFLWLSVLISFHLMHVNCFRSAANGTMHKHNTMSASFQAEGNSGCWQEHRAHFCISPSFDFGSIVRRPSRR